MKKRNKKKPKRIFNQIVAYAGGPGEVCINTSELRDNSELRIPHTAECTFETMVEDGALWPWRFAYERTSASAIHYAAWIDEDGRR